MNRMIWCVVLSVSMMRGDVNYANTFGKTHFIVGMPKEAYATLQEQSPVGYADVSSAGAAHKILFSPDDDIHTELLRLIQDENHSIKIAMYLFTDKDIAQALRDARERGVYVECVTDASCISNKFNKMDELAQLEIPVWVYRAASANRSLGNAMHHKFMIFGSSGKVVTGSLNITNSAQKNNQENIVILCDGRSVQRFDKHFDVLKTRCSRLTPQKSVAKNR